MTQAIESDLAPAAAATEAKPRIGLVPAGTVFLSAFLLFQVQPLIGKYILPWFGGAPGVWTACLLFFQVALLAGYAYAHLVISRLTPRKQAILHAALLLAACVTLPIIPAERWKPPDPLNPTGRIVNLLTVTVGLAYFALATTAPLLQAWVARIDPRVQPYRLYALSNAASLMALLSYPLVFEPVLSRREQAWAWSGLFVLFAAGCAYCAMRASRAATAPEAEAHVERHADAPPSPLRCTLWVALPACASALLMGTTNTLTQDVAPVPFLWVLPLALYLLTFVLAFDHPRWYSRRILGPLMIAAAAGIVWAMFKPLHKIALWQILTVYSLGMFVICLTLHGELARLRPHPRRLTGYYLAISAGGALGGAIVSLLAPRLFNSYLEFGLSVWLACGLVLALVATDPSSKLHRLRPPLPWVGLIAGMCVLAYAVWTADPVGRGEVRIHASRNFYGVLRVHDWSWPRTQIRMRSLEHGRTRHGTQALDEPLKDRPLTYYGPRSGVGQAMRRLASRPQRRVGVVGLGVGSIAALTRPGDVMRFYEIDHDVIRVARSYFTHLQDAPASVEVVLGDARLSLEREPPQGFDLLVLDAFSGDAIPVHLLTREAFAIYQRHVKGGGLIAVHTSNRHLNLRPVVEGAARSVGMRAEFFPHEPDPTEIGELRSTWAVLSPPAVPAPPSDREILWTDDRVNLLGVLREGGSPD